MLSASFNGLLLLFKQINNIPDCTQCPVGVNCNDVTGCVACQGSYQPDCKQSKLLIGLHNL